MKSLKTLLFACLLLFLCLGKAFAATCYAPNYGYYECNPNYQSYSYPDEDWGAGFFGVMIGGGSYYGDGHEGRWNNEHGDRGHHGGDHRRGDHHR